MQGLYSSSSSSLQSPSLHSTPGRNSDDSSLRSNESLSGGNDRDQSPKSVATTSSSFFPYDAKKNTGKQTRRGDKERSRQHRDSDVVPSDDDFDSHSVSSLRKPGAPTSARSPNARRRKGASYDSDRHLPPSPPSRVSSASRDAGEGGYKLYRSRVSEGSRSRCDSSTRSQSKGERVADAGGTASTLSFGSTFQSQGDVASGADSSTNGYTGNKNSRVKNESFLPHQQQHPETIRNPGIFSLQYMIKNALLCGSALSDAASNLCAMNRGTGMEYIDEVEPAAVAVAKDPSSTELDGGVGAYTGNTPQGDGDETDPLINWLGACAEDSSSDPPKHLCAAARDGEAGMTTGTNQSEATLGSDGRKSRSSRGARGANARMINAQARRMRHLRNTMIFPSTSGGGGGGDGRDGVNGNNNKAVVSSSRNHEWIQTTKSMGDVDISEQRKADSLRRLYNHDSSSNAVMVPWLVGGSPRSPSKSGMSGMCSIDAGEKVTMVGNPFSCGYEDYFDYIQEDHGNAGQVNSFSQESFDSSGDSSATKDRELCYDSDPGDSRIRHQGRPRRILLDTFSCRDLAVREGPVVGPKMEEPCTLNTATELTVDINVNDETESLVIIENMCNEKMNLIWHPPHIPKRNDHPPPMSSVFWIERGAVLKKTLVLPKLMWKPAHEPYLKKKRINASRQDGKSKYTLDLLDISRVYATSSIDRNVHPFARKGTSFVILMVDGTMHMFEAPSRAQRDRTVLGLKMVVARLATQILLGIQDVYTEFFFPGGRTAFESWAETRVSHTSTESRAVREDQDPNVSRMIQPIVDTYKDDGDAESSA